MDVTTITLLAIALGFVADSLFGDPEYLPHPIVGFGKAIAFFERNLNTGKHLFIKGLFSTLVLVFGVYLSTSALLFYVFKWSATFYFLLSVCIVFFSLAGKTLRKEVNAVFEAVQESEEKGRKQLARIVGRDTSTLQSQQIQTAALETLSENLSDGVIAPLFWLGVLGPAGMFTYKMVNTLDSMIGYKNEKFLQFGKAAAILDDIANYLPARLTAFLMLLVSNRLMLILQVNKWAKNHSSPNSGFPEAALASILNCRFGGPNYYFGQLVEKPYIGHTDKILTTDDLPKAIKTNLKSEWVMLLITIGLFSIIHFNFG